MANRKAPSESAEAAPRRRSLATDGSQVSNDGQSQTSGPGHSRRRSSRTNSTSKESQRSSSPSNGDADVGGGRKSKSSRNTLKRLPRRDSVHVDLEPSGDAQEDEPNALGFIPKLGQIQEGKVKRRRTRASSSVASSAEPQPLRRRHTEDNSSSGPRIRHKHGSENLIDRATSSSTSVLSRSTQQSTVSAESHSTITPKSNDSQGHITKREPPVEKKPLKSIMKLRGTPVTRTAEPPVNALQLSHGDITIEHVGSEDHNSVSTSSAVPSTASPSEEEHNDDESSSDEKSDHVSESPPTSPTSSRKPGPSRLRDAGRDLSEIKVPLFASSFVHGHEGEEEEEEEEDDDDDDEEEESEKEEVDEESHGSHDVHHDHEEPLKVEVEEHEEGSDESSEEEHYRSKVKSRPRRSNLRRKVHSPSAPSTTSSGNTDPHTRRLRRQEQELANHVRSPRPSKDYQFSPSSSSNGYPPPPMPPYRPEEPSHASPGGYYDRHQAQTWPLMPPLPAPLPIAYGPMSPEVAHAQLRSPQENTVQQHPHPFPPYPAPPLHCQPYLPPPDLTKTTVVGYELLADKLSESPTDLKEQKDNMVPMYRKFEHLNHRVLLHLQDEICEMEEELRYLDECIAQSSVRDEAGQNYPASRRNDARYGHELHYKRTELLGRIFQKLGQYNQALFSFNNLLKDLDPASPEATNAYRAWIEKREPIDYVETRFLDRKDDLLAVSRKQTVDNNEEVKQQPSAQAPAPSAPLSAPAPPSAAVVWLPMALILPLIAFAMIPNLIGRLVVMVLIGGAELKVVTSTPELMGFMTSREWIIAGSVYFGLNVVLASLVR